MADEQTYLPEFFVELLAEQYTAEDVKRILAGCDLERAVTLRANTLKATRDDVARALDDAGIAWSGVSWYDDAFVIEGARERGIWELPIYQEGGLYLQSLSSMMPVLALGAQPGDDVLDMCAAPGGKTTQILACSQGKAYVTAVEMHAPRADKLQHNLDKLGASNVTVMRTDARRLDDFFSFDRILLDAPCSGSGTLRAQEPKTAKRFTPTLVDKSAKAQRALLKKALALLRPGGTLVFSTCSVLARENEDAMNWALRECKRLGTFEVKPIELFEGHDVPLLPTTLEGALCLCPTDLYEGFFMAAVKRTA